MSVFENVQYINFDNIFIWYVKLMVICILHLFLFYFDILSIWVEMFPLHSPYQFSKFVLGITININKVSIEI